MANTNSNKLGYNGGRAYGFLNKPVEIDCNFIVNPAVGGLGITALQGSGVQNVFMHTSNTPTIGANGMLNPNPAVGYAMIQLNNSYSNYCGGDYEICSPNVATPIAINASALTVGKPYVINSVGAAPNGAVTIAPVADVSGSLASKYFSLYDSYGNTYIIWFSVSGVGSAPIGVSGILIQQTIASGATAATIGAALVTTIGGLLAAQPGNLSAPSGVFSFTASGTTTVTVTSTVSGPLPGVPMDGALPTGFTFVQTVFATNLKCWQGVGLPKGFNPAVGQSFIASAVGYTTGGSSSGNVYAPSLSGVTQVEFVGDPGFTLNPGPQGGSPNVGGWLIVQFLAPTSSSVTTMIPTAPVTGSNIFFKFLVEAGSIIISGE